MGTQIAQSLGRSILGIVLWLLVCMTPAVVRAGRRMTCRVRRLIVGRGSRLRVLSCRVGPLGRIAVALLMLLTILTVNRIVMIAMSIIVGRHGGSKAYETRNSVRLPHRVGRSRMGTTTIKCMNMSRDLSQSKVRSKMRLQSRRRMRAWRQDVGLRVQCRDDTTNSVVK